MLFGAGCQGEGSSSSYKVLCALLICVMLHFQPAIFIIISSVSTFPSFSAVIFYHYKKFKAARTFFSSLNTFHFV